MEDKTIFDSETKIWSSPSDPCVFNKDMSVGAVALTMMKAQPKDRVCQISVNENTKLTFGEACQYAVQVAEFLKNLKITDEDVVGIVTPNTTVLMPVMVGCWLNCTPVHVVSTGYDEDTLSNILGITKPKLIFCDGKIYEKLNSSLKTFETQFYTLCNHLDSVKKVEDIFSTTKASPWYQPATLKNGGNQTMAIYSTSGTTGAPKCVPYPNSRIIFNMGPLNSVTKIYSTSGPEWGTGLLILVFNILRGAERIMTTQPPDSVDAFIDLLEKYEINYFAATPMQIAKLTHSPKFNKTKLPHLNYVFMTGSACTTATLKRFRLIMPHVILVQSYGCTEFGSIAFNVMNYEMGVLGKISSGVKLKIINTETGKPADYNENGEICVRRDEIWTGYLGNEKATREVLDDDGWTHTGDIGYMDESRTLHFIDRSKEILKYNGLQFSVTEIENVISELTGVEDVCVFGVFNEEFGDLAAAAIVKSNDSTLSVSDVEDYVRKRLIVEHKCLHYGVFFVETMLRNANGKFERSKMREMCLEMKREKQKQQQTHF